jgi:hypothetical protein
MGLNKIITEKTTTNKERNAFIKIKVIFKKDNKLKSN